MKVLITGSAGFIGFHFSKLLLEKGITVIGIDGAADYYDIKLKEDKTKYLRAMITLLSIEICCLIRKK